MLITLSLSLCVCVCVCVERSMKRSRPASVGMVSNRKCERPSKAALSLTHTHIHTHTHTHRHTHTHTHSPQPTHPVQSTLKPPCQQHTHHSNLRPPLISVGGGR